MLTDLQRVIRFTNPAFAFAFADRCAKLHLVLLGDDGRYWVGLPVVTERLHRAGYEYAR